MKNNNQNNTFKKIISKLSKTLQLKKIDYLIIIIIYIFLLLDNPIIFKWLNIFSIILYASMVLLLLFKFFLARYLYKHDIFISDKLPKAIYLWLNLIKSLYNTKYFIIIHISLHLLIYAFFLLISIIFFLVYFKNL